MTFGLVGLVETPDAPFGVVPCARRRLVRSTVWIPSGDLHGVHMTDDAGIVKLEQRPELLHNTYTHSIAASMGTLNDGESPSTR